MSDSDLMQAIQDVELPDESEQLAGTVEVKLIINVHDAVTPVQAVDSVINAVARQGLANFFWLVTSETGNEWNVMDGHVYSREQLEAMAEAQRQEVADDEPDAGS